MHTYDGVSRVGAGKVTAGERGEQGKHPEFLLSSTAFCKNTGHGASGKKKLRDHEK